MDDGRTVSPIFTLATAAIERKSNVIPDRNRSYLTQNHIILVRGNMGTIVVIKCSLIA